MSHLNRFVVEYDLPSDSRRKRFYRRIRRYLRTHWRDEVGWSTGSVVFTEDRDFAMYVWREARAVGGVAHVYEAKRIDPLP